MDNNLPPYQSKIARLNQECADTSLLQDCIPGQKWKCINEDGRWRKHKCKFHREVQNHLAEVNKYLSAQSKRNCACFTPDGVVYTKIKSDRDMFLPKQKRFEHRHKQHNERFKREVTGNFEETFINQVPPEFLSLLRMDEVFENMRNSLFNQSQQDHLRKKREADYMTQTIDELSAMLGTIEQKYKNATSGPLQCFVIEPSGKVNCSTIIYENKQAWKQSRVQIDLLIKALKHKMSNLKDIKRHLKEHRPINMTSEEENYENSNSSIEEHSEEIIEEVTKASRRKHSHPGNERKKITSSTTEDGKSDQWFSSSPVFEDSTTALSPTPSTFSSNKQKNRTKLQKPLSTTTVMSTYDDYNSFSSTSDSYDDFSISQTPDISSTTEDIRSTLVEDNFNSKSVTIDATIIESKPRHRQNLNANSGARNVSSENHTINRNVPADCYCEPEFER